MRIAFFAFLAVAAVGLVTAILVGVALKIVGFLLVAFAALAVSGWVLTKLNGPRKDPDFRIDAPHEMERISR